MSGSHWIATYVKDNVINYFDSYGMQPFQELVDHAKRKKLNSFTPKSTITKPLYYNLWLFLLVFLKRNAQKW